MKLTSSEIETISIHMNAFKEKLCNQGRWNEAQEYQDIVDKLDELLTAESVIRCKDCKHWLPHTQFGYDADYEEYHNYCNRHLPDDDFYAFRKEAEDYCSWAERKEE